MAKAQLSCEQVSVLVQSVAAKHESAEKALEAFGLAVGDDASEEVKDVLLREAELARDKAALEEKHQVKTVQSITADLKKSIDAAIKDRKRRLGVAARKMSAQLPNFRITASSAKKQETTTLMSIKEDDTKKGLGPQTTNKAVVPQRTNSALPLRTNSALPQRTPRISETANTTSPSLLEKKKAPQQATAPQKPSPQPPKTDNVKKSTVSPRLSALASRPKKAKAIPFPLPR